MKQPFLLALRVAGIALVTLILLETVLQLGALVVRATAREAPAAAPQADGALRLLALGDSNTYGLYLERDQAYPALLEREWNRLRPGSIEVVNLGYPGNSSSAILRDLAENLRRHRPQLVTLMVGVNDFWTFPVQAAAAEQARGGALGRLRDRSRVYKLGYMLVRQLRGPVHGDPRADDAANDPAVARLDRNLDRIAALAREHDARLVILTYPFGELQTFCNHRLRRFAARSRALLVDTAAPYAARCGMTHCAELLFDDNHPSAAGHAMIAAALGEALSR